MVHQKVLQCITPGMESMIHLAAARIKSDLETYSRLMQNLPPESSPSILEEFLRLCVCNCSRAISDAFNQLVELKKQPPDTSQKKTPPTRRGNSLREAFQQIQSPVRIEGKQSEGEPEPKPVDRQVGHDTRRRTLLLKSEIAEKSGQVIASTRKLSIVNVSSPSKYPPLNPESRKEQVFVSCKDGAKEEQKLAKVASHGRLPSRTKRSSIGTDGKASADINNGHKIVHFIHLPQLK